MASLEPGSRVGRYEILDVVRGGRLSEVFRARDTSIDRLVAIKLLPAVLASDAAWRRRFELEVRAAGRLDHPNVLSIFDVGDHEGRPYLVSEWLEGETVRQRMRSGAIRAEQALPIAIEVARGLEAAHAKGVIHRDLKPENLFLTADGRVKILDFGLARIVPVEVSATGPGEVPTLVTVTDPGVVMGTVGYMSPEQVRGKAVDARSDLFSFGAVLYEMTTGQRAFAAESEIETLILILREEPPPIPDRRDFPPELARIVSRCLEKDAKDRFQTASDVAFVLEGVRTHAGRERTHPEISEAVRPGGDPAPSREVGTFSLLVGRRRLELPPGEYIVGRGHDAAIRLDDASVSRHHAKIVVEDGRATLVNLRSKNGTRLRGKRIDGPALLADGDEIGLGSVAVTVRVSPPAPTTETQTRD